MLKARNRKLSMLLVLAMLMTMFVGVGTANAAVNYTALSLPVVQSNAGTQNFGILQVDIDNCAAIAAGDVLTISFSSEIALDNAAPVAITPNAPAGAVNSEIVVPELVGTALNAMDTDGAANAAVVPAFGAAITPTRTTLDITFTAAPGAGQGRFLVYLKNVNVGSVENEVVATILGPAGGAFPAMANVTVARVDSQGGTMCDVKSVKTFGSNGGVTDSITILETIPGRLPAGDVLELKLPNGYTWVNCPETAGTFAWGYAAAARAALIPAGPPLGVNPLVQAAAQLAAAPGATVATIGAGLTALGAPAPVVAAIASVASAVADVRGALVGLGAAGGDVMDSATLGGTQLQVAAGDPRILQITIPAATTAATGAGQLRVAARIAINDAVAKEGDISVSLSDAEGKVTETDLVVGKYASYSVKVVEDEVKDLVAGKAKQKIGKFNIQEGIAGSLLANRSVKLTLPQGVKWWAGYRDQGPAEVAAQTKGFLDVADTLIPNPVLKSGTIAAPVFNDADANFAGTQAYLVGNRDSGATDEGRTIKFSTAALSTGAAKIQFENLYVDVSPDFAGDLVINVTSDAGVSGEVKVASVNPKVELSAENISNIRIGEQDQLLGDLIITETKKEAIARTTNPVFTNGVINAAVPTQNTTNISITLPAGASWSGGFPKVEIVEGDLDLDTQSMAKIFNAAAGTHTITIPVKSESTKASKIKVSGMKATLNRVVPEGDFKVAVSGISINETGGQFGGVDLPFAQFEGNKVAVAKCVTPAPTEGTSGAAAGEFRIDSNIYYVGGAAKVMDAAPYIKDSRTYVPMRFLGEILGAEVVWDDAARTVTLTRGDDVVVFTIGSTSYTVNGETMTADVAPEIANSRTMLPARFVAEAFGAVVGWDPGTKTVLISK